MSPRLRSALVLVTGLAALYAAASVVVNSPGFLTARDFAEYWSAGAANLRGENPYDPAVLLPLQQLADPNRTDTVMMWNPPWSLALYMPLGWLSPRWATLLWVVIQFAAVILSADLLWRTFGGPDRFRWVAQLVALSFVGTWWTVTFGQNTGLLLLGVAGFAYFRKLDRPAIAGAFAALTALKPHLLAVFGVLFVLDAVTRRGRIALASGSAVVAASLGLALLANPDVIAQYREALRNPAPEAVPLSAWKLPVASYWLRVWLAPQAFWVQFVPCLLACAGYAVYRLWRGRQWGWTAELPGVVAVSVLVSPYGGWIFDLSVLLVPVVWLAARAVRQNEWGIAGTLTAGQLAVLVASQAWVFDLHQFYWVAPAVLAVCLAAASGVALRRRPRFVG